VGGPSELGLRSSVRHAAAVRAGAGRVVQVRPRRLVAPADVDSLSAGIVEALLFAGPGAVICADYRQVKPLSPHVVSVWARAMRSVNQAIAGSALLLDPSNTIFNLQVQRAVHCAGNSKRRVFTDLDELRLWVDRTLTHAEREALDTFLASDGPR
jgi:hypothetical protein